MKFKKILLVKIDSTLKLAGLGALFFSTLLFLIFFGINHFFYSNYSIIEYNKLNENLIVDIKDYNEKLKLLENELVEMQQDNNYLRLAVQLNPFDLESSKIGFGGSSFDNELYLNRSSFSEVYDTLLLVKNKLIGKVSYSENNLQEIKNQLTARESYFEGLPSVVPTVGLFRGKFGMRIHPILRVRRMHKGIDIVTDRGTKVFAPGRAVVLSAGYRKGYGLTLELDHGFGFQTLYAHLSKIVVKVGSIVNRGDHIALTGNSGELTVGPHLHYEVKKDGIPLNPRDFIFEDVNLAELSDIE